MVDATQVQIRRGTEAQISGFVPVEGEVICDLTNDTLRVGDGTKAGGHLMPNVARMQSGQYLFATAGGTGNAVTVDLAPSISALTTGMEFRFLATSNNTGATTLNLNGLGAIGLRKISGGSAVTLASGDISSGVIYSVVYDGTYFILLPSASPTVPQQALELIESKTVTGVTQTTFAVSNFTDYDIYKIEIVNWVTTLAVVANFFVSLGTATNNLFSYRTSPNGATSSTPIIFNNFINTINTWNHGRNGTITISPQSVRAEIANSYQHVALASSKAAGGNLNVIVMGVTGGTSMTGTFNLYGMRG